MENKPTEQKCDYNMWFTIFVSALIVFVIGMATFAVGEYLVSGLTPFTLPIGGLLTLGGGLVTAVAGIAVIVSGPE